MNTVKVQEAINQIVEAHRASNAGKYRQHEASKKYIKEAEELGILEFIPTTIRGYIGNTEIQLILKAAKDNGSQVGGFNAAGEGDVVATNSSELYKALNQDDNDNNNEDDETILESNSGNKYTLLFENEMRPNIEPLLDSRSQDFKETARFLANYIRKNSKGKGLSPYCGLINIIHIENGYWDVAKWYGSENPRIEYYEDHIDNKQMRAEVNYIIQSAKNAVVDVQKKFDELSNIMTASEVADEFGITRDTVHKAMQRGDLPYRESASTKLVHRKDVEKLWSKQ